ncbi:MAG TPA: VOC family protein [Sorangium sp.]|nr:VOC family protein [Sorangium sp.]
MREPSEKRPFKVLGVQQIALGAADKAPLLKLWVELLGLPLVGSFRSERENVDEAIAVCGVGPLKVEVDLMQPIDVQARPRVDRPALNHVGLWVDDLRAAKAWLTAQGMRFAPGGIRPGAAGHDVCFIHPKGNEQAPLGGQGVLIELVQAPAEVRAAFAAAAERG